MKVKALIITSDTDGVGYHRNFTPHFTINEPDFEADVRMLQDGTLNLLDERFMSNYNILFYNKTIPFARKEISDAFTSILKKYNIKVIYDIDDYWILSSSHLNYDAWKKSKADEAIIQAMKDADLIVTTTPLFAERISEVNPNVAVLPNAINLNEQQWTFNRSKSSKIRFLWGGGISHMVDLRLLKTSFELFDKDFLSRAQLFMCGYDLRVRTPRGMLIKSDPKTNQWSFFEDIFTCKGKYIFSQKHKDFLNTYDDKNYGFNEEYLNEFYQRRWTRPILNYGHMYNEADVCLAPLKNNSMFNFYKSNLKVVEAGAHHCPIIASNYGPYTIDDIDGKIDGKQKGFLIDENEPNAWYNAMKFYADNPEKVREHGENLYEYVKNNLSTDVVGQKRKETYQKLITD
jgi:glycosyltransferase involved in cell wall biosynthesis